MTSLATVASEPRSMRVMRLAAKAFGSPSANFCQLAKERHEKTTQSSRVVTRAAHLAKPRPLPSSKPQTTERPPKTEPENQRGFCGCWIGEEAGQSAEKKEYAVTDQPLGICHGAIYPLLLVHATDLRRFIREIAHLSSPPTIAW